MSNGNDKLLNRPALPWLTLEGNPGPEEYMWQQQQEMEALLEHIRGFFDGWQIQYWDLHWDKEGKRWIIEIHPAEPQRDIIGYYRRNGWNYSESISDTPITGSMP